MEHEGLVLHQVDGPRYADVMTAIHVAAAQVAYAHIFDCPIADATVRARWSAHAGPVALAVQNGAAAGFAAASGDQTLEALCVLPNESGSGVGSALLQAIAPVSRLWVLEANVSGRLFYERRGWRWSGLRHGALDADDVPTLLYISPESRSVMFR